MDAKYWREISGITLSQIALEGGYKSTSYISDVERGIKSPSLRLAKVYHRLSDGQVNFLKVNK